MARQRTGSVAPKSLPKKRRAGSIKNFLLATGRALDLALEGPGFFVVETPSDRQLTRWGHFFLDSQRRLCTEEGYGVAGTQGELVLPPRYEAYPTGPVTVTPAGDVLVNRQRVGALALVLPLAPAGVPPAFVRQGYLEISSEEVTQAMRRSFSDANQRIESSAKESARCD